MMKTQARPAFKLKYFECQRGNYHDGEVLNYVCISKNCENKGLICSVCKNDHDGHNIIPLKYLLSALKTHQQQPMESENFQKHLQDLQELKNSFLYDLKVLVQKLSESIQQIEEKVMENFKSKKIELLNQISLNMKFNDIIEQTIKNKITDQQTFQRDFKTIASLVEKSDKENSSKRDLFFQIKLQGLVKEYEDSYKSFSRKVRAFEKSSEDYLNAIFDRKQDSSTLISLKQMQGSESSIKTDHVFSLTDKGSNMKIESNNKQATCSKTSPERFALLEGKVQPGSKIRFKIHHLSNWVGLGVAIRGKIKKEGYKFLYNNIGHGSFLISNNGYNWSHAYASNNLQVNNYKFNKGDTIKIEVEELQLNYTNQTNGKTYSLPICLKHQEWEDACFCINLCTEKDSVIIL